MTRDQDDEAVLRRLRRLGRVMDSAFRVPGTRWRIGADALIGLIPGVGDTASAAVSLWIVNEARRLDISSGTLLRMLWNVLVDAVVGSIPLLGDLFDAGYKANQKNVDLIERDLRKRGPYRD